MDGWIKIYRKLLEWEWYNKSEMVHLFIHLLLNANREDKKWKGIDVKKGQLITGLKSLSYSTGISIQTVRTCLERLEVTGEINKQSNNQYTIVTICNYADYQQIETKGNKQTNNRLTNDQQATNNKQEYKNIRSKEYSKLYLSEIKISDLPDNFEKYFEVAKSFQMLFKNNLIEAGASTKKIDSAKGTWINDIRLMIESDGYNLGDLREVFAFLQKNAFWKKNILSTSKLREQMDKLKLEINGTHSRNSKEGTSFEQLARIIQESGIGN